MIHIHHTYKLCTCTLAYIEVNRTTTSYQNANINVVTGVDTYNPVIPTDKTLNILHKAKSDKH